MNMDLHNKAKHGSKYAAAEQHFRGLDRHQQIAIQNLAKLGVAKNFMSGLESYNFPMIPTENLEPFMILCTVYPIKDENGL